MFDPLNLARGRIYYGTHCRCIRLLLKTALQEAPHVHVKLLI